MENNVNKPVSGMVRDLHPHNLKEGQYTYALNTVYVDMSGEGFPMLQNEPSNILCSRFKEGYKVIGHKLDLNGGRVYFFLTNPETGNSEIGYISSNADITNIESDVVGCNCNFTVILEKPLEDTEQEPYCTYNTIISDECNQCLNFDIRYPIHTNNIQLKDEKCGKSLYWTDNYNPPRYLNLDRLEEYSYVGIKGCGTNAPTCLDCEKLVIFKSFARPCLNVETIEYGGNLRAGTYEFLAAYCDALGNEISQYFSITQPVSIFDPNKIAIDQTELDYVTNFGIRLSVDGLDPNYAYYKVAVIQRTGVNNETSYFEEGIHTIGDTSIIYTNSETKPRTTLNKLLAIKPTYTKASVMASSNGYLFMGGLEARKEVNLQPVANLMGAFLRWGTHIAKESLYKDGVEAANKRGYMRDEVYPFSIKFIFDDGFETAKFVLANRPPTVDELETVSNMDVDSILEYSPECSESNRTKRWQYYNTASVLGTIPCSDGSVGYIGVTRDSERNCTAQNVANIANLFLNYPEDSEESTIVEYINTYRDRITDPSDTDYYNATIAAILTDVYPDCLLNLGSDDCVVNGIISRSVLAQAVGDEIFERDPKPMNDYDFGSYNYQNTIYRTGTDGDFVLDEAFMENYMNQTYTNQVGVTIPAQIVWERFSFISNSTCFSASELTTLSTNSFPMVHGYYGGALLSDIQQNQTVSCTDSDFSNKLHVGALWYKVDFNGRDNLILEFTPSEDADDCDDISVGQKLRLSTFDACGDNASNQCQIWNISDGLFFQLDRSAYSSDVIYIAVDAPYEEQDRILGPIASITETVNVITPPCSAVLINLREAEYVNERVTATDISFIQTTNYDLTCTYQIPDIGNCGTAPLEYGKFGYYESTDKYPCNNELYDSSALSISPLDIPDSIRDEFEEYFVTSTQLSGYELNEYANLSDNQIRHYRFPDNCVSPFMSDSALLPFNESVIFPIGVRLDNEVVNAFLDIAVRNSLITAEQRSKITSYEIFRGDRTLDRGVVAKGLSYDIYKYTELGEDWHYPNYPYNDLGEDQFNFETNERDSLIVHPYGGKSNIRYTFHSPDTHFLKPSLPTEVKMEGYQMGHSRGRFNEVEDHSKWVVLGNDAYTLAFILATAEVVFETTITISEALIESSKNYWFVAGPIFGNNAIGSGFSVGALGTITAATAIANATYKLGRYRYEWLKVFRENGTPRNFAAYYASEGWYNRFICNDDFIDLTLVNKEGNSIRGTAAIRYVKPGNYKINDTKTGDTVTLNNFQREDSVYISFGSDYPIFYDPLYYQYDNNSIAPQTSSRFTASQADACETGLSTERVRNIGSPYMSLKVYRPNQYGKVNDIKWLNTSYCGDLIGDNSCDVIFGGDIFISRFSLKRKIPFYYSNAIGLADYTPFEYYSQRNIGYPRYYCNYSVDERSGLAGAIFPDIGDDYDFDCPRGTNKMYVKPPSRFYLFSYGIPQFLVESEINVNYRNAGKQYFQNFYPNVGDYMDWTQEVNVSIKRDNEYRYNFAYSKQITPDGTGLLPPTYDKELYACRYDAPNGVVYSVQDNSEQDLTDPWLIYRPLDFYQFPTSAGRLVDLRSLESTQVLGRFENQVILFNAIDTLRDRLSPENAELGNAGIFGTRPLEFSRTDLGYAGTQHKVMVSCEYGHFWADSARGKVFQIDQNGKNLREITQGLSGWFREYLPFKILQAGFENIDIDNAANGIGLTMAWDSKFTRVFLTKKDYILRDEYRGVVTHDNGRFFLPNGREVFLHDASFFIDASFTVAYCPRPDVQAWVSYYSFAPNYYISHQNYFQSGVNASSDPSENGLWSHLLTNKSYQVFYGKRRPWTVEYPFVNKYNNSYLRAVNYWLDVVRYHNDFDFAEHRGRGFDYAWIYNMSVNSGQLNLVAADKNDFSKRFISNADAPQSKEVMAAQEDKQWSFNHFYNRVRDERNNVPIWLNDKVGITKRLNEVALDYFKPLPERMRGDWFLIRLSQERESRLNYRFKWSDIKSSFYL